MNDRMDTSAWVLALLGLLALLAYDLGLIAPWAVVLHRLSNVFAAVSAMLR